MCLFSVVLIEGGHLNMVEKFDVVSYKTATGMPITLDKEVVKNYLCDGKAISDQEFYMFASMCKELKANPFLREAYIVKYGEKANIFAGLSFFNKRAADNPDFDGIDDGVIAIAPNGEIKYLDGTFVPEGYKLAGGWARVYRKSLSHPKMVTLNLKEYCKVTKEGKPMSNWATMPAVMINKCAKVAALREAFPKDFSGVYTEEEFNGNYVANVDAATGEVVEAKVQAKEPVEVVNDPADPSQIEKIKQLIGTDARLYGKVKNHYGFGQLEDLTVSQASEIIKSLKK